MKTIKYPNPNIGDVNGRLTVIDILPRSNGFGWLLCQCECGQRVQRRTDHWRLGTRQSCGCWVVEITREKFTKHGKAGACRTPEYDAWAHMLRRCHTPSTKGYENYGGRGIFVCERWQRSFEDFLADMGERPTPKHSLERIDNNKGYSPENCKWATYQEQANNTRRNVKLSFDGKVLSLRQWSRLLGLGRNTLYYRLSNNWSVEEALTAKGSGQ